jgi:hypothetical protein
MDDIRQTIHTHKEQCLDLSVWQTAVRFGVFLIVLIVWIANWVFFTILFESWGVCDATKTLCVFYGVATTCAIFLSAAMIGVVGAKFYQWKTGRDEARLIILNQAITRDFAKSNPQRVLSMPFVSM